MESGDKPSLLIIGSGGHASVLVDAIESAGQYNVAGYLDDTVLSGTIRGCYAVLGGLDAARNICDSRGIEDVVIAIGNNWWRRKLYSDLARTCPHFKFPVIVHPSSVIAPSATVGRGSALLAGSHIGPNSSIGELCIVNTHSSLDHDCKMHDFSSVAPGVVMGGVVEIGECSAIGVGASISDRISIGKHTLIGTGSVVVRNTPDLVVAYGNPARIQRPRREGEEYL